MAGGAIPPVAIEYYTAAAVYPANFQGAGAARDRTRMSFVVDATTLAADAFIHLVFMMPKVLPLTGAATFSLLARANTTTGSLFWEAAWANVTRTESPDDATLTGEGEIELAFDSAYVADAYKESTVLLNHEAVEAGVMLHMDVRFDDGNSDHGDDVAMLFSIDWR